MSNFISLQQAIDMISLYRNQQEKILDPDYRGKNILVYSETFDAANFKMLLEQDGCTQVRIYYGMSTDFKVHAIIVGVNNNEDMLDVLPGSRTSDPLIIEEGTRCPPQCPASSRLNP